MPYLLYSYKLKRKIPLLNEEQWQSIENLLTRRSESIKAYRKETGCSLEEAQKTDPVGQEALQAYHEMSGQRLGHPDQLYAVRLSKYGRPCHNCEKPFRTPKARLCAECGFELPEGLTAGSIDVSVISHTLVNEALFSVFHENDLIGYSRLEYGDPPMGVAQGRFMPSDNFLNFRSNHKPIEEREQRRWEGIKVVTEKGENLQCEIDISIIEYGDLDNPFDIEVICIAIANPDYSILFPHHVAAYDASF